MISHILLAVLCCLAIAQDIHTRKIKNSFNVTAALLGLLCLAVTQEMALRDALLGFCCAFGAGLLMWRLGAIRGGDAKFLWCVGIIKGWKAFWITLLCAILAGGVIALGILIVKRDAGKRFRRLWNYIKGIFLTRNYERYEAENPQEFPFSIPMAVGCLAELVIRVWY